MTAMPSADREALRRKSAPLLLCERARTMPDSVAFRSKHLGLYRERSWHNYATLVARTARVFAALGSEASGQRGYSEVRAPDTRPEPGSSARAEVGLARGERVAIMGDACEEWMICDLAAQSLGAIVYGIYPTASASEVEYQMRDGGAVLFIAENQEYVDKILPMADRLPALQWIVVLDDAAMFAYAHPKLRTYEDLLAAAGAPISTGSSSRSLELDPNAPAFIVYTSGTTGHPKGALVAHGKHLAATANIVDHYPTLAQKEHRTVAYLPLCHVLGRDVAVTLPLISRLVPHFGEDPEDLPTTLFEIAPTVLFTVPRYLQKFASQVLLGILNSSGTKRAIADLAMRFARGHAKRRWNGKAGMRAGSALSCLPGRRVRADPQQARIRPAGAGDLRRRAAAAGDDGALADARRQRRRDVRPDRDRRRHHQRPARPISAPGRRRHRARRLGGEARRDGATARCWCAAPTCSIAIGTTRTPPARSKAQTACLRTGDIGEWRDGALRLIDRARDFIVTSGGKTISPSFIENMLRTSPYVAEAVVFGHGRKYLTALIEIDADTVSDWARSHDVPYTGFTSLATSGEVVALIGAEIERANGELARVEQIKDFRILPKALDPEEDGEPVTPTRKVKRDLMYERFKTLVEEMYDDREERLIAASSVDIA